MENELIKLGLNDSERKVYLSCLKQGLSKASEISEDCGIDRQAVYYTLKLLMQKGMITESIKSGIKYYSCIDPLLLIPNIKEEQRIKENSLNELAKKYKELNGISIKKPKVEIYSGLDGFKTAAREMLNVSDKEVYSYISEKIINFRPIFLEPYVKQRAEKKLNVKVISEKTPLLLEKSKENKKELREIKYIDSIIKGKDYEMAISKEKVIFLRATDKDQYGIKIEDEKFAEFQMNIFKLLWELAKK